MIDDHMPEFARRFLKGKPKVSSDQTLKRKLCALSSFFDYYFQEGFIGFNPLLKVSRPIVSPHPPAGSNMQDNIKLLEYVSDGDLPFKNMIRYQNKLRARDTAILTLIIGAGIKSSECVELNISDVDMEHNNLVIRSRREPNQVYFSPYIAEVLSVYLTKRLELITVYGHDDALFLSLQMKRLGIRSIEKMLKKYSSLLFGDENNIQARNMRNAFKKIPLPKQRIFS